MSPAATIWPSSNGTETTWPSIRDLTATVCIGCTVPIAVTVRGTGRRSAAAKSTGWAGASRRSGVAVERSASMTMNAPAAIASASVDRAATVKLFLIVLQAL